MTGFSCCTVGAVCNCRVDCHVGLFAWWVLLGGTNRGQASRVVAVEPMPQNIAVMQANLERHSLSSQVVHALCPYLASVAEAGAMFVPFAQCQGHLQHSSLHFG